MSLDQPTNFNLPSTQDGFEKHLVLAVEMATYDGHRLDGYQWVMTNAESKEDALQTASCALEPQGGCLPVAAFTTTELRELADALSTREIEPHRAYNLTADMTDTEIMEADQESDDLEPPAGQPAETLHATRPGPSQVEPDAF